MHRTGVLAALAALAAALAAAVVVDRMGDEPAPGRVERQILPELSPEKVTAIVLERPGEPAILLERGDERFSLAEPVAAPVDPAAVRDLIGALELLVWRRRLTGEEAADPARGLDPPRLRIRIEREGGEPLRLDLGAEAEEVRGAWVRRADRRDVFLIQAHEARALDRGLEALRSRRPFALDPRAADRLTVAGAREVVLRPAEPGGAIYPAREARADPERAARLLERVDGLAFLSFADEGPRRAELVIGVAAGGSTEELRIGGACPGEPGARRAQGPAGSGCIDGRAVASIERLLEDGDAWVDRRLVAGSVEEAVLEAGGTRLPLDPVGAAGGAVRDWLERLSAGATGEVLPADEVAGAPEVAAVELRYRGGRQERVGFFRAPDGRLVARRGDEGAAIALGGEAAELLEPAPWRFRPRRLLSADATDLRRATGRRGGTVLEQVVRGRMLGDWEVAVPEGAAADPEAMAALAQALAPLRAERAVAARARALHGLSPPRRIVEAVLDPPPGESEARRVEIAVGAASEEGCYARLAGDPVVFELAEQRCEALLGPWTRGR